MSDAPAPRNGRRNIWIGVGTLLVLAVLVGVYWLIYMRGIVSTDDARFDAELVDVAPQVTGQLAEVLVREGDAVTEGQPLYRLDVASLEASLHRAEATEKAAEAALAVAQANLEQTESGARPEEIRKARATEQRTRAEAELAEADWHRAEHVFEQGALATADRDRAKTAWETAEHAHEEAAASLALLEAGARREERIVAEQNVQLARSQLAAAQAATAQARIDRGHAGVTAPFAGVVVRRWSDAGSAVAAGQPVITLMNPSTLHVSANIEEKDLHDVALGDPVTIHVDAYPDLDPTGHVATIVRGTRSLFSLIPAEGVSGSFIKVTQRVPIRIDLDRPPEQPVGPGLSVEIRIDTRGHDRDGRADDDG